MNLDNLNKTIDFALRRCLTIAEIIEKLLSPENGHDIDTSYIKLLQEKKLSDTDSDLLKSAINRLELMGEKANKRLKEKINRTIPRILKLLSSHLPISFAQKQLEHRLKSRRKCAYAMLRDQPINDQLAQILAKIYREKGDQEALELIARNPSQVCLVGATFLINNIKNEYWRARVIEALLMHDRSAAYAFSHTYPCEYARAVGRYAKDRENKNEELLHSLVSLFQPNSHDEEFVSMYAYALGRLKARHQLLKLQEYVNETHK